MRTKKLFTTFVAMLITVTAIFSVSACKDGNVDDSTGNDENECKITQAFSIDLDYESEVCDVTKWILSLFSSNLGEQTYNALINATKMSDYYISKDIYLLSDGTYIVATVDSLTLQAANKVFDPESTKEELAKEKYELGTYRYETDEKGVTTLMLNNGNILKYKYDASAKTLMPSAELASGFKSELFNETEKQTFPDVSSVYTFDYSSISTDAEGESKYLGMGSYEVASETYEYTGKYEREININGTEETWPFFQFKVWYPKNIETANEKYPVVIFSNGTGTNCIEYGYVFEHLASYGFICIGNDQGTSKSGFASEQSLLLILGLNEDKDSKFYEKVDTANIGGVGHSQGGIGAVKAVTEQPHGNMYKALFIKSSVNTTQSDEWGWSYDTSKINISYFGIAGTGVYDAGNGADNAGLSSLADMQKNYNALSDDINKIFARRKDADHDHTLTYGDGYMTAWFLWQLKGDESAKALLFGPEAEILTNDKWQDVTKNF